MAKVGSAVVVIWGNLIRSLQFECVGLTPSVDFINAGPKFVSVARISFRILKFV